MSICRAQLCNTCNVLTLRISGRQIHLQVPPKLFRINSWIVQMIRQWIPDCWSGNRKCTDRRTAAANSRNWQLITSGRLQMLATSRVKWAEHWITDERSKLDHRCFIWTDMVWRDIKKQLCYVRSKHLATTTGQPCRNFAFTLSASVA